MAREALRRLLWLGPTVFLLTLPLFWLLARTTDHGPRAPTELPIFFNPNPKGVRERALEALHHLTDPSPADAGTASLSELGGAALPHVLPRFDALGPDVRGRAALALAPIAERMGIGAPSDFESKESAVLFFSRFWQEHSIDYKPAVSRRAVRRFAEHPSSLRRAEVVELDTYALEDLIDAMSGARRANDASLVGHLSEVAAHVTGNPWTLPPNASAAAARRLVRQWEAWWIEHRHDYVAFTGTSRVGATLFETRYGRWVEELSRRGLGTMKSGRSVARTLAGRAPVTFALVAVALLVGYPVAFGLGVLAARSGRSAKNRAPSIAAAAVASAGTVGLCAVITRTVPIGAAAAAGCLVALTSGAEPARSILAAHARIFELSCLRTELAFGASPLRVAWRSCRFTAPLGLAAALADLPALFTSAFVVEKAFSLRGLSEVTVTAVKTGDLGVLIALALVFAVVFGVAQILSDTALARLDPRPVLARPEQRAVR